MDVENRALMNDFNILNQIATTEPKTPLTDRALHAANEIMSTFRSDNPHSIEACRKIAERLLGEEWEKDGADVWKKGEEKGGLLWGLSHSHLDTAWLWPFSSTQQKVARTWSSQVCLFPLVCC